jgi:DNA invertase Pin-like site-specific DNA recombinase
MQKAIAYLRVSTKRQGRSGLSLDAQQKMINDFAKHNGYVLINEYTEVNSGSRNHKYHLHTAISECRRKAAVLIIAKLDRLSRDIGVTIRLMESDVSFVIVESPFAEEFEIHLRAAFAHKEHKDISRRTVAALAMAKAKGIELGKHGRHVLAAKNRLQADSFAREMKPVIEALRQDGITSTRKIVQELNKRNLPSFKGGNWHRNTVHRLLTRLQIIKEPL